MLMHLIESNKPVQEALLTLKEDGICIDKNKDVPFIQELIKPRVKKSKVNLHVKSVKNPSQKSEMVCCYVSDARRSGCSAITLKTEFLKYNFIRAKLYKSIYNDNDCLRHRAMQARHGRVYTNAWCTSKGNWLSFFCLSRLIRCTTMRAKASFN